MDDILSAALAQLDQELAKRKLTIHIVICGAYAIHLLGYSRAEYTLDVDSITELNSNEVKQIIKEVGQKLGLGPHWLNEQASNHPPANASKKILSDFEETLHDLKKSQNKMSDIEFKQMAYYFGIAIQADLVNIAQKNLSLTFMDIEIFFLSGTLQLKSSRIAESFLCWLLTFGHLLSPAKIRRLILAGYNFDHAILGGFIEFLTENNIMSNQWKIVRPFCKKMSFSQQLLDGPTPRSQSSYFLKYRIIAPQFQLNTHKFLLPVTMIYKNCLELRNRALFGSVVNADVASYLQKNPDSTAYQIAKNTHHHKARVFEVYEDVLAAG